jgi:outer membrane protein assembly factor BamB
VDTADGTLRWKFETQNFINGVPAVSGERIVFGGCDGFLHVVQAETGTELQQIDIGSYVPGSVAIEGSRGYVGHYGEQVQAVDLDAGKILWSYKDREFPYFSSPAIGEELVVIGCRDKRVHAMHKSDGSPAWTFQARRSVDGTPIIVGDRVAVGADDGFFYVLELKTGRLVWRYETGRAITGAASYGGGLLLTGCADGAVYAFGPGE